MGSSVLVHSEVNLVLAGNVQLDGSESFGHVGGPVLIDRLAVFASGFFFVFLLFACSNSSVSSCFNLLLSGSIGSNLGSVESLGLLLIGDAWLGYWRGFLGHWVSHDGSFLGGLCLLDNVFLGFFGGLFGSGGELLLSLFLGQGGGFSFCGFGAQVIHILLKLNLISFAHLSIILSGVLVVVCLGLNKVLVINVGKGGHLLDVVVADEGKDGEDLRSFHYFLSIFN